MNRVETGGVSRDMKSIHDCDGSRDSHDLRKNCVLRDGAIRWRVRSQCAVESISYLPWLMMLQCVLITVYRHLVIHGQQQYRLRKIRVPVTIQSVIVNSMPRFPLCQNEAVLMCSRITIVLGCIHCFNGLILCIMPRPIILVSTLQ